MRGTDLKKKKNVVLCLFTHYTAETLLCIHNLLKREQEQRVSKAKGAMCLYHLKLEYSDYVQTDLRIMLNWFACFSTKPLTGTGIIYICKSLSACFA